MRRIFIMLLAVALSFDAIAAEASFMSNVYGRDYELLNGKWNVIVDLYEHGKTRAIYKNRKPQSDEQFYEYSFEGGMRLNVPGDWNSQCPKLEYFEGTVWYARHFDAKVLEENRQFLYFGAVSYRCNVYLNGFKVGSHEGGFTPFQIEVTDKLRDGDNFIVVEVNNRRTEDAIPALMFDWWNYGGITRDVMLIQTPKIFINDYFIQLDKHQPDLIHAEVTLSDKVVQQVRMDIPELKISRLLTTDENGRVSDSFKVRKLTRWAPNNPKLYRVIISSVNDRVEEEIGFRNIEVEGTKILVNGESVFMRCVSFHEEIPQRQGRAFSQSDAQMLISEAEALGVNMVRLAHYPQNEYIVRLAEKKGILLWQEIPVWQDIDFADMNTRLKAQKMLTDMIYRDRNRCAVGFWSIANETLPSEDRNVFLTSLLETGKSIDTTRLYTAAFYMARYNQTSGAFEMDDDFMKKLDVIAVNKYLGWYHKWPAVPSQTRWNVCPEKPLIISEFGGEALYGQHGGEDIASSWSEEYQAKLYRDNIEMFRHIGNLAGVSPWILFDFRSPYRYHPANQDGWNRKGLVSDQGYRKKAWYIMRDYYEKLMNEVEKGE